MPSLCKQWRSRCFCSTLLVIKYMNLYQQLWLCNLIDWKLEVGWHLNLFSMARVNDLILYLMMSLFILFVDFFLMNNFIHTFFYYSCMDMHFHIMVLCNHSFCLHVKKQKQNIFTFHAHYFCHNLGFKPVAVVLTCIYSQLSLSRIPWDSQKHFEISVPLHIRVAEVRKTIDQTTTFNKWICNLTPEVRNIYIK